LGKCEGNDLWIKSFTSIWYWTLWGVLKEKGDDSIFCTLENCNCSHVCCNFVVYVIGYLFQLNYFACLKMPLLERYMHTHNFYTLTCVMRYVRSKQSLSFIIVKIPMIYVKSFKQPHIFIMFCFFEKNYVHISQTLRRDWNAQHPKNNKLTNNSPFLDHWCCVIILWNHLPIQQF
jgi:hypothetical protein